MWITKSVEYREVQNKYDEIQCPGKSCIHKNGFFLCVLPPVPLHRFEQSYLLCSMLSRLSSRERKILEGGAVFLVISLIIRFLLFPVLDRKNALEHMLNVKKISLNEMGELQTKYDSLLSKHDMLSQNITGDNNDFSLFSFLDSLARDVGIKEKIAYMKPDSRKSDHGNYIISGVKLKVDGLTMKELVDFMFKIETTGKGVVIASIALAKTSKGRKLDVVMEAETVK